MTQQIIKFKSGENIICDITRDSGDYLTILNPMQMFLEPKMTKQGYVEHVSLSKWMQPYTEQNKLKVRKDSIITIMTASEGMRVFFKRMLLQKKDLIKPYEEKEYDPYEEEFDEDEARRYLDSISPSRKKVYH